MTRESCTAPASTPTGTRLRKPGRDSRRSWPQELVADVLLTDYLLPDVDGVTVARRLKADRRTAGIRILLVTGYGTAELAGLASAAGIERVLLKPCLPHAVMREVGRVLSRPLASGGVQQDRPSRIDMPS